MSEIEAVRAAVRAGLEAASAVRSAAPTKDGRTRSFTFSSEIVVDRWFGGEVLDHSAGSVRMDFIKSGNAPFLLYHDTEQPIGVIESAKITKDKVGGGTVRFGRTQLASDALDNVDDRILNNTSVGYRVYEMVLESSKEGNDTYRIMDWEPFEVSLVAVPADPTVGIDRSAVLPTAAGPPGETPPAEPTEARSTRASSSSASETTDSTTATTAATRGVTIVTTETTTAASPSADERKVSAMTAESERRLAIQSLCKANRIDGRVESEWIRTGIQLTDQLNADGTIREKGVATYILEVMEARGKQKPMDATMLGLTGKETQRYSLFRAIRALRYGGQRPQFMQEAAFEIECSNSVGKKLGRELTSSILIPAEVLMRPLGEAATRAMSVVPGSKGGYMVDVDQMGFIDILRNRSVAMAMGARRLGGLQGNVVFPRQSGKPSVTWQAGEGTSVTAADQTLGQLSMTPKTCIAITDISEQLLAQATPSAEAFVMADLAADVAIDGVDNAAINGTGGAQPLGIKNTTGITSGQDAASATYAKILAFVSTAGGVNAIRGNPGWVTNTAGAARLMQVQRFTSTDTPLWTGNMLNGSCVGFNAMSSEQLSSGNLIFGSWDELVIGEWGVLELSTDNSGTRFNQAQVGIRAMWMVDILLRYPQAFVVSTNLS